MNKTLIISNAEPTVCDKLTKLGYKLIYTECVDGFISYEQKHADMQCIVVENKVFVLSQCNDLYNKLIDQNFDVIKTEKPAGAKYPKNILLNAKIVGKNLIGKIDSLDKGLVNFCIGNGYNLIDVNQGYAACSILKVADNAIITSDESIYKALKNSEIDVLKICSGYIKLAGAKREEDGFIGGASVNLGDSVLFFGDIKKHPDYKSIVEFCLNKGVNVILIEKTPLTDIGGAVLLNISQ